MNQKIPLSTLSRFDKKPIEEEVVGRGESNLANSRLNGRSLGGGTLVRGWGANTRLLNNAARRPVSGNNRRGNYRRSIEKNLAWIIISPLARSLEGRRGREDDDEWKSGFTGRWMKMWGEGRKKEKKNKEDGVWGKGRGRGGIRKRQKKTRLDGVDEARGKGEGWLKQILNGQPQADIAFL